MQIRFLAIAAILAAAPGHCAQSAPAPSASRPAARSLVGRIGAIAWDYTRIYDGPYRHKVYNICRVGQPVILTGWNSQWYGVRMVDGRTGWVYRGAVQLLAAEIHIPEIIQRNTTQGYTLVGVPPLLRTAFSYVGIPYRWGGTSASGIDCSGYVRSVFRQYGVDLPRVARDQARVGAAVPLTPAQLRPGDRLYFACHHRYVDHTGIYWGGGLFIHSSTGRGVDISPLWDGGTYQNGLVTARRTWSS
ncbi:MAG TPA: C40 family peptidase [Armatimonadota bacterium]|jgi:hypothetical protein